MGRIHPVSLLVFLVGIAIGISGAILAIVFGTSKNSCPACTNQCTAELFNLQVGIKNSVLSWSPQLADPNSPEFMNESQTISKLLEQNLNPIQGSAKLFLSSQLSQSSSAPSNMVVTVTRFDQAADGSVIATAFGAQVGPPTNALPQDITSGVQNQLVSSNITTGQVTVSDDPTGLCNQTMYTTINPTSTLFSTLGTTQLITERSTQSTAAQKTTAGTTPTTAPTSKMGTSPTPAQNSTIGTSPTPAPNSTKGTSPTPAQNSTIGTSPTPAPNSTKGTSPTKAQTSTLGTTATPAPTSTMGTSPTKAQTSTLGTTATPAQTSTIGTSPTKAQTSTLGTTATPAQTSTIGTSPTKAQTSTLRTTATPAQTSTIGSSSTLQSSSISSTAQTSTQPSPTSSGCPPVICEGDIAVSYELLKTSSPQYLHRLSLTLNTLFSFPSNPYQVDGRTTRVMLVPYPTPGSYSPQPAWDVVKNVTFITWLNQNYSKTKVDGAPMISDGAQYVYNLRTNGRKSAMIILGDLTSGIDSAVDSVNTLKAAGFSVFTISDSPDFTKLATNSSYYFPFVQDPTGIAQTIADSFCTPNSCSSTTSQMTTGSQTTPQTSAAPSPSTTVQTSTVGTTPTKAQTSTLGTTATPAPTSTIGSSSTLAQTSTATTSASMQSSSISSTAQTSTQPSPTTSGCPPVICEGDIAVSYELLKTSSPKYLNRLSLTLNTLFSFPSNPYQVDGRTTRVMLVPYPTPGSYSPQPAWDVVKNVTFITWLNQNYSNSKVDGAPMISDGAQYVYNLRANGRKSAMIILGDLTSGIDSAVDSVNTLKTAGFSVFTISDSPDFTKLATNSSYYFPFVQDPTGIAQTIADSFCTPNPCYSTTSQMTTGSQTTPQTSAAPSPSTTVQTSTAGTTPTKAQTSTLGTTATTGQTSTLGTTATTAQTSTIGTSPTIVQTSTATTSAAMQSSSISSTAQTSTQPIPTTTDCPPILCEGDIAVSYELLKSSSPTYLNRLSLTLNTLFSFPSNPYQVDGKTTRVMLVPYPTPGSYSPQPAWDVVKNVTFITWLNQNYSKTKVDGAPMISDGAQYVYNLRANGRKSAMIILGDLTSGIDSAVDSVNTLKTAGFSVFTISDSPDFTKLATNSSYYFPFVQDPTGIAQTIADSFCTPNPCYSTTSQMTTGSQTTPQTSAAPSPSTTVQTSTVGTTPTKAQTSTLGTTATTGQTSTLGTTATTAQTSTIGTSPTIVQTSTGTTSAAMQSSSISSTAQTSTQPIPTTTDCPPILCEGDIAVSYELLKSSSPTYLNRLSLTLNTLFSFPSNPYQVNGKTTRVMLVPYPTPDSYSPQPAWDVVKNVTFITWLNQNYSKTKVDGAPMISDGAQYVYNLRANGRKSAMIILGDLTSEIDSAVDSVNTLKTAGFSIFTISDSPDFAKLATNSSYYFPFVQDPTGIAQTIADSFCTPNPCYSTTSQMTTSSQTTTETLAVPSPSTTVQTSTAGTTPTTAQTSTLGTTATTGQTSTLGTTATTAQTSTIGTSPTTVQTSTMGSSSTLVQTSTIGSTLTSTSPSLMSTTPCVVVTTSTLASTTATMPSPTSDPVCPGGACVYNGDISILYEQTSLEKQDEITSYVAAIASSLYFSIGGATRITVIPYPFSVSYYPPPDWTAVKTLAGLNSTLEIYELSWDDSATDPDMSSAMNYLYQNLTQTSRPLRTATIIGYNNQDVGTDVTTQAKKSLTDSGYKIYTISLDGQGGLSSLASERNFDATSLDQVKTAADQIALSGIPSACCPTLTSITAFRPETSQYSSKSAFGNKQSMEYCKSICNLIQ